MKTTYQCHFTSFVNWPYDALPKRRKQHGFCTGKSNFLELSIFFRICVLFPASGSVSAAVAASLDQGLVDDVEGDADDSLEGQEPDVEAEADQSADQFGYHLVSFVKRCSLEIIRICELSNLLLWNEQSGTGKMKIFGILETIYSMYFTMSTLFCIFS